MALFSLLSRYSKAFYIQSVPDTRKDLASSHAFAVIFILEVTFHCVAMSVFSMYTKSREPFCTHSFSFGWYIWRDETRYRCTNWA